MNPKRGVGMTKNGVSVIKNVLRKGKADGGIVWACKFLAESIKNGENIQVATRNLKEEIASRRKKPLQEMVMTSTSHLDSSKVLSTAVAHNALSILSKLKEDNVSDEWVVAMLESVTQDLQMVDHYVAYQKGKQRD